MQTPYFLIDVAELQNNIDTFRSALHTHWPNGDIAYSVKTNSLPWVLGFMRGQSVLAEVVSQEEYDLAINGDPNDTQSAL